MTNSIFAFGKKIFSLKIIINEIKIGKPTKLICF